jgi:hypothetical protein
MQRGGVDLRYLTTPYQLPALALEITVAYLKMTSRKLLQETEDHGIVAKTAVIDQTN